MQIPNMHLYANILDIYAKNMLKYAKLNMHKYAFLNMHNMLNIMSLPQLHIYAKTCEKYA